MTKHDPTLAKGAEQSAPEAMSAAELDGIMKALGLSPPGLARRVGVSRQTVWRWLAGTHNISGPAVKLLRAWAEGEEKEPHP